MVNGAKMKWKPTVNANCSRSSKSALMKVA